MVTSNEKYQKDESGQWWYAWGTKGLRTRARISTCAHCGEDYLTSMKRSKFCGRRCSGQYWAKNKDWPSGPDDRHWRGGRNIANGYIRLWRPDHPSARHKKKPYVMEHRLVMEEHLGRFLKRDEHVHHLNGIKDDNRLENLELWTVPHPRGVRKRDKHCPTCTCGEVSE